MVIAHIALSLISQGLSLLLLVRAEPFLRRLAGEATVRPCKSAESAGNDTNDSNESNETNLTTIVTTIATTTTATTVVVPEGGTSDNSALVVILIIIGALVLLALCGGAIYGGLLYRQGVAKENIQLVKQAPHESLVRACSCRWTTRRPTSKPTSPPSKAMFKR